MLYLQCYKLPESDMKVQVSTSLGNSGLCWTVFTRNRDTAVPAEGNGDLQILICVLVARPRRCLTLSNPVPWQNWMADYLSDTLQMRTLFRGWPIMVNDTHTRRRRSARSFHTKAICLDLQLRPNFHTTASESKIHAYSYVIVGDTF